ncbi:MAG TPA: PHB depolymerase family esterase [Trichormus sp.]
MPWALSKNLKGHINIEERKRTYHVHIPKGYNGSRPIPLVVVLHGAVGNSSTVRWDSRMSAQSDRDCFLVAYPNGVDTTWNAGACCGPASEMKIDDIAFLRKMIEKFEHEYSIDRDRICVAGVSNGGMLAYRVGRELSDVVACIAPVSACMYPTTADGEQPVSVIAFNGTHDGTIAYYGGIRTKFGYRVKATPVKDNIQFWVDRDHCKTVERTDVTGDVTRELHSGGDYGTEVCLYTVHGGKHSWPGGRSCTFWSIDKFSQEISATDLMCKFFWAHPKQREVDSVPDQSPVSSNKSSCLESTVKPIALQHD